MCRIVNGNSEVVPRAMWVGKLSKSSVTILKKIMIEVDLIDENKVKTNKANKDKFVISGRNEC